ncbi:MAG: PAS domain-containing protein [Deltaproteobacteria bacterium]|nr:MAG: PAS domain-containing protein [Deltaproteobacteria bacterium]
MRVKSDNFIDLYRSIIETISLGLVVWTREGSFLFANPQAQDILSSSPRGLKNYSLLELLGSVEEKEKVIAGVLQGKRYRLHDVALQSPSGRRIPVDFLDLSPLGEGGDVSHLLTLFRPDEESIVDVMNPRKFLTTEEEFSLIWRGISHEIKNPLGGIKGAAQMLLRLSEGREETKTPVEVILREVERITSFIDSIGRDSAREDESPINLALLLKEAVEMATLIAENEGKKVHFSLSLDPSIPPVSGERDSLFRVFLNLLKNSVEAIEGEGEVVVSMRIHEDVVVRTRQGEKNLMAEIEIYDTGKPVGEGEEEKIFLPFYSNKPGGSGMGLFIAASTVRKHGGYMKMERKEKGKSFLIFLPIPAGR